MKVYCLASSSSGNCFILDFEINGAHKLLMVECGLPLKDIYKKCNQFGLPVNAINECLITHSHKDHCRSARELSERGVRILASAETLEAMDCCGQSLEELKATKIAFGLMVMPFKVEHDANGSFGFIIKTPTETVIFVNDNKFWTTDLRNFKPDYVFVECNYDEKVVYAQMRELKKIVAENELSENELKDANTRIKQHERNINAHSSLRGTLVGLSKMNLSKCKAIFLMHLSDRYANEYKMKNAVKEKYGIDTYVCKKDGGVN